MNSAQEVREKSLLEGGERSITIPSNLSNLAEARRFVAETAAECGFGEDDIYAIKLATGEAVANAVEHGSPDGEANCVTITCLRKKNNFLVVVKDEGHFKKRVPGPSGEDNYRGRGIPLMLAVMDKVTIDEKSDGTRVTLTKALPAGSFSSENGSAKASAPRKP